MRFDRLFAAVATTAVISLAGTSGGAQNLPEPVEGDTVMQPVEGDYVIENFEFNTGETIPEMNVHYTTLGDPSGEPVLVLHGTTGTGSGMASGAFAEGMFGPGDPFDVSEHYVILPDSIGTGGSSKPSDGMRAEFPRYNYDDMVEAQYRLVKDGLGIDHLRAIIGNSMGGMHVWTWGVEHPDFADALIPMASLPGPMAGRN